MTTAELVRSRRGIRMDRFLDALSLFKAEPSPRAWSLLQASAALFVESAPEAEDAMGVLLLQLSPPPLEESADAV